MEGKKAYSISIKERLVFGAFIIAVSLFWEIIMVPEAGNAQSYEGVQEILSDFLSLICSTLLISVLLICVYGAEGKGLDARRVFVSSCLIVGYRILVRMLCCAVRDEHYGLVVAIGVIEWIGVIWIIHARSNYKRRKGLAPWWIGITIVAIIAVLTVPISVTSLYGDGARYLEESRGYIEVALNRQFLIYCARAFIVAIYVIALWVALCLKTEVIRVKEKRRWMSVLVRGIIYFMVLFTIPIVKIGAIPYGSIGIMREALLQTHYPFQEYFKIDSDVATIVRVGIDYNIDVRFQSTKYCVWYADKQLMTISVPGSYPGWKDGIKAQRQSDTEGIVHVNVNGLDVGVLQNRVFMYVLDNEPRAFDITRDLSEEDVIVTAAVEALVAEGNWDVFLNAFAYCCKFDYEFIHPFLMKYSAGDFSAEEKNSNSHIDETYIAELCRCALE